jgi:hypothetical protein
MKMRILISLLAVTGNLMGEQTKDMTTTPQIIEQVVLGKIWSAVPVRFDLLTHGDRQYVAYFNADRRTVVAMRTLGDTNFVQHVLPSRSDKPPTRTTSSTIQGWDSHNYLTLAVDSAGHIHLAGNMHANPLTYFRSRKPGDVTTLAQVDAMVGKNETRCTYPKFLTGPRGELIFHYRDGGSGNGNEIYNVYDVATQRWQRLLDTALTDGQGKRNAYLNGPLLGPDGWYHLLWVWRESPDAATCNNLSYARSRDLRQWETAAGQPLTLPITLESAGTIIDPIPVNGGIINGCHQFGFDSRNRIVVTYHKHDAAGNTQAYAARFENGAWRIRAVSKWEGKHVFSGGGSGPSTFGTALGLGTVTPHGAGKLALSYRHWKAGSGLLVFDENTLEPLGTAPTPPSRYPKSLLKLTANFPGLRVNWREDGPYVLRWETLGTNRDRPRDGELPENGELVLYRLN